jgi:hypothetical protein
VRLVVHLLGIEKADNSVKNAGFNHIIDKVDLAPIPLKISFGRLSYGIARL